MTTRFEEKYILDYRHYVTVKNRVSQVMETDPHSIDGGYTITSMYFDDVFFGAYYEKEFGLAMHKKFRIRSYNCSDSVIRLERKIKRGHITEKESAYISSEEFADLSENRYDLERYNEKQLPLISEMKSMALQPAVTVRYKREAFVFAPCDVRVTFDREIQALPTDLDSYYDCDKIGTPAIHPINIIMEVKYTDRIPMFVRRLTGINATKLSVSKYALCTSGYKTPIGFNKD